MTKIVNISINLEEDEITIVGKTTTFLTAASLFMEETLEDIIQEVDVSTKELEEYYEMVHGKDDEVLEAQFESVKETDVEGFSKDFRDIIS